MAALASFLLVIALAAWQQVPQQPGGAAIEGTVVDASGSPVKDVQIQLGARPGQAARRVRTDEAGRFTLNDLTPGAAVLTMSHEEYLGASVAQQLAANGRYRRQVVLTRAASISGRIFDSDRHPAAKIEVQLLRDAYDALGNRSLTGFDARTPFDARSLVRTNEKGEYRISGLSPGNYYIRASHAAEPARRTIGALLPTANHLASTYYPGVSAPDEALPFKIAAGVDVQAVDFSIEPLSPFKIAGRIVSPLASIPSDRYSFFLVRQDNRVRDGDGLVPDMDGDIERFEFRNVPRGSYVLFVAFRKALSAADPFLIGRTSVNVVDGDVRDLIVTVAPGIDVTGTWKSDDPAAGKRRERGPIALRPADGLPDILAPEPILHDDGTVEVSQVPPGRYVLSFALPQTVYVATARFGSRDVIGQPFEIDAHSDGPFFFEFSTSGGTLSGTVADNAGKPVAAALVVLVPPIDLRMDSFSQKTVVTDAQGRFSIGAIRPGLYTVYSIPQAIPQTPGVISTTLTPYLNYGTQIEIGKDQRLSLDLTLTARE